MRFTVLLLIPLCALAQTAPPPDCPVASNAAISGGNGNVPISPPAPTAYYDNRGQMCTFWAVSYRADSGLSGYTVAFESSPGPLTPSGFVSFAGNTVTSSSSFGSASSGAAIYNSVSTASMTTTIDIPWIRVHTSGATGTGNIYVTVEGWRSNWTLSGAGSGGGGGSSGCPGTVATPCQIGVDNGGTSMPAIGDSSGRMITVGAGTAGTPAGGVHSIQGAPSMTPVETSPTTAANAAGNPFFNELSDGTNTNTIKPASTASVAADKSLVVQINPNQPNLTTPFNVTIPVPAEVSPTTAANTSANPFFNELSDGTNTNTIKPASTASVAADKSLVVQINPNQPNLTTPFNVTIPVPAEVSPTTAANTSANPFFNELSDGTNTNTIKPASTASVAADKSLVVQINPNQPAIPAAGQGATGSAVPAGATYQALMARTSYPTAATNGNLTGAMSDKAGRPVSVLNTVRDLVGTFSVQSTSASAQTLIAAGASGVFNDIITLTCTTETLATATIVSISDNGASGNIYKFNVGGTGGTPGFTINMPTPLPQGTSASAWDILNSAAVTLDCNGIYAKNQ